MLIVNDPSALVGNQKRALRKGLAHRSLETARISVPRARARVALATPFPPGV